MVFSGTAAPLTPGLVQRAINYTQLSFPTTGSGEVQPTPFALVLFVTAGLGLGGTVTAAEPDLFELPLEELLRISVVSASAAPQTLASAPATIRVITAEQIAERGYRELDEALRDLPGIDVIHVHGAYPSIYAFRGSYGDENRRLLLMLDGVVNNSLNGSFELGGPAYSLIGIERIEVIWGPASALYGANAYAGTINLITKRPTEGQELSLRAGGGSFGTRWQDAWYGYADDRQQVSLSTSHYRSDGPSFKTFHPEFNDAYVDGARSLLGRWSVRQLHGSTSLALNYFDTPMGDGLYGNSPTVFLGLPRTEPLNRGLHGWLHTDLGGEPGSRWHPSTRSFWLEQSQNFTATLTGKLRLLHRQTGVRDDSYSYSLRVNSAGVTEGLNRFAGAHDSYRNGLDSQLHYRIGSGQQFSTGLQIYWDDVESGYRVFQAEPGITVIDGFNVYNQNGHYQGRQSKSIRNAGLFGEYVYDNDWFGGSGLTVGGRVDDNSLYGSVFNPRLGWTYSGAGALTVKYLYGTAYRAPTVFELYGRSVVRVPNPDLQPERLRTHELSLSYPMVNSLWSVTYYRSALTDVITDGSPLPGGLFQVRNAGAIDLQGVEFSVEYQPAKALKLFANMSVQQSEQTAINASTETRDVPNTADHKANLGLHIDLPDWGSIDLIGNYIGARHTAPTNPHRQVPAHTALQLHLRSASFWGGARLQLSLHNALDADYDDPGFNQADGVRFAPLLPQPGRSGWVGLEWGL